MPEELMNNNYLQYFAGIINNLQYFAGIISTSIITITLIKLKCFKIRVQENTERKSAIFS